MVRGLLSLITHRIWKSRACCFVVWTVQNVAAMQVALSSNQLAYGGKMMENFVTRRPSDGFPFEFDVSVDGVHDQFPPAVPYTAFDLATTQAATHGQGEVSVKAAVH